MTAAAIILIFAAITMLTIFILSKIKPDSASSTISAKDLISSYKKDASIIELTKKYYNQQNKTNIEFKLNNKEYSVNVESDNAVTFTAKEMSIADDTQSFQDKTASFMTTNKLTETSVQNLKSSNSTKYKTFSNQKTVCQLIDIYPPTTTKSVQTHSLACIDMSTINAQYSNIEKLLAISQNTNNLKNISDVQSAIQSQDNISYATMVITSNGIKHKLLFAAVDNSWSYIGEFTKDNNGQYKLTTEMQKTISNPKYKEVLINIFVYKKLS